MPKYNSFLVFELFRTLLGRAPMAMPQTKQPRVMSLDFRILIRLRRGVCRVDVALMMHMIILPRSDGQEVDDNSPQIIRAERLVVTQNRLIRHLRQLPRLVGITP